MRHFGFTRRVWLNRGHVERDGLLVARLCSLSEPRCYVVGSVRRGFFYVVDHEDIDGTLGWLKPQPELLLKGGEQ